MFSSKQCTKTHQEVRSQPVYLLNRRQDYSHLGGGPAQVWDRVVLPRWDRKHNLLIQGG